MKHDVRLTVMSLLSILFFTIHLADEISRGLEPGTISNLIGLVLIATGWMYGTLRPADRRSGYVILFFGALLALAVAVLHFSGRGVGRIARTSGGFLFVWILLALGVMGLSCMILCVRGLRSLQRNHVSNSEG
jgi:hypothetical protein